MLQELPKRISTAEEAEILTLLCKVHELEIGKVCVENISVALLVYPLRSLLLMCL